MKQDWSSAWKGSSQPRKQRKFRYQAPLHARRAFLSAHLSRELRREFGRRALPLRKGDEVLVMKGSFRGFRGPVERVDLKKLRVYVNGVKVKKVDGSEVLRALQPGYLLLTKPVLEDKMRRKVIERKRPAGKPAGKEVPAKKEAAKKEEAPEQKAPQPGGKP